MQLGVVCVHGHGTPEEQFRNIADMGFGTCQLISWDTGLMTGEEAERIKFAANKYGVKISAFWCGWRGAAVWDFYDGQETLGIVPVAHRAGRIEDLKKGSDFAALLGVDKLVTHAGFIPENPHDSNYPGVISAIRTLADYCKQNGQSFMLETGQETPVTLLRAIQDAGRANLGINLDPANLIMYGKANPVDALEVFGKYVVGVHAKDGFYPTDGRNLGREVPIGEGRVDFPALIKKLDDLGYDQPVTIEREISGEGQKTDILKGKRYLENIISTL